MGNYKRSKEKMNADFEVFKSDISWFVKPDSYVEFLQIDSVRLSEQFENVFPMLAKLIERSRQTHLIIDSQRFILFAWNTKDNQVCGWLNKYEDSDEYKHGLAEEHELLLKNIGGIQESFNQPEYAFSNNQNFMFIGSQCSRGIGSWNSYYSAVCQDEQLEEIDYSNLLAFVSEANGALTLYDLVTKEVLLFSHDHSFEDVIFLRDQPKYTFHTFKNVNNFTDYVEALARQWLTIIK